MLSPLFFSAFVLSFHFLLFNHFFSSGDSIRVHCVDLGESFPTHTYLQNLASIQTLTSPVKFARSPRTDPPGVCGYCGEQFQPGTSWHAKRDLLFCSEACKEILCGSMSFSGSEALLSEVRWWDTQSKIKSKSSTIAISNLNVFWLVPKLREACSRLYRRLR